MALARVKTWNPGDILTAADLNAEFNNILNNPISLVSPLTGNLSAGLNQITNLALENLAADPAAATKGRIFYNTASQSIQYDPGSSAPTVTLPVGGYQANCRLVPVTSSQAQLQPYQGNKIPLKTGSAWDLWTIPSAGVNLGSSLWSGTGSTFNYVYAQNVSGTITLSLKTSAVAHSASTETGVEVATTDSTLTLVGCAVGSSLNGVFFSTYALNNGVLSFYNRKSATQAFGYTAGRSVNTSSFSEFNTEIRVYTACWGDEIISAHFSGSAQQSGAAAGAGYTMISADGALLSAEQGYVENAFSNSVGISLSAPFVLSETGHYITLLGATSTGQNLTMNGASTSTLSNPLARSTLSVTTRV